MIIHNLLEYNPQLYYEPPRDGTDTVDSDVFYGGTVWSDDSFCYDDVYGRIGIEGHN